MFENSRAPLLGILVATAVASFAACSDDETTDPSRDASAGDAPKSDASPDATSSDAPASDAPASDAVTTDAPAADASDAGPDAAGDAGPLTAIDVALVYAGRFNNIDQRLAVAYVGSDGRIVGYDAGATEAPFVSTATIDGIFSDGFAGQSRWTNGDIVGPFNSDGGPRPIAANDGQHLGIAKVPSVNLPDGGTISYTLAAATKPTLANGASAEGTVSNAALTAQFDGNAGTLIGYSFLVTMPDGSFLVSANGGATQVGDAGGGTFGGDAGFRFTSHSLAVATDAGACAPDAGACPNSGSSRVVFSGPNAERIVIAYIIGSGSLATNRRGVVVFQRP